MAKTASGADGTTPFPPGFQTKDIQTNGTTLHVRVGGQGPAARLCGNRRHVGGPLAADLVHDHTIVVADLRGMGLSSRPPGGYDKKTQGRDIAGLLDTLEIKRADLVTHDIGNMVGYSFSPEPSDLP